MRRSWDPHPRSLVLNRRVIQGLVVVSLGSCCLALGPEMVASSTSPCISVLVHVSEVGRFNILHLFVTFFGNILLYHSQIEE